MRSHVVWTGSKRIISSSGWLELLQITVNLALVGEENETFF